MDKFFEVISSLIPIIIFIVIIANIKKYNKKARSQTNKSAQGGIMGLMSDALQAAAENSVKGKSSSLTQRSGQEQTQAENFSPQAMMNEPIVNKEPEEDLGLSIKNDWRAIIFIFIIVAMVIFLVLRYVGLEMNFIVF